MLKINKLIRARFSRENIRLKKYIKNIFGFYPENIFLYELALRHRSMAKENGSGVKNSNERLEFLGDAIIDAVVADYLFKVFPLKDEGFLTQMRSKIVSRTQLNKLGVKLGFLDFIDATRDVKFQHKSLNGDTFEALIGAIYLDKGYDFTSRILINKIFKLYLDIEGLENIETNHKSRLIEWSQKEKRKVEFRLVKTANGENTKIHVVEIFIDDKFISRSKGTSIKMAEQAAAEIACELVCSDSIAETE